jgi:uncharacterized protein (DUF1330 family)
MDGEPTMKCYAVARINVTDRAWVAEYLTKVTPMVERHGGRYLARTPKFERLEGEGPLPQLMLLIEWPSHEAAKAFYDSDAYRPYREARIAGSTGEFLLVSGEDVNRPAQRG